MGFSVRGFFHNQPPNEARIYDINNLCIWIPWGLKPPRNQIFAEYQVGPLITSTYICKKLFESINQSSP
jgi:hypothetical protein